MVRMSDTERKHNIAVARQRLAELRQQYNKHKHRHKIARRIAHKMAIIVDAITRLERAECPRPDHF